jgi:hypothetical protein
MPSNQLSHKPSHKPTLQVLAAFATLFLFALAVGCTGFFVNPTLTGVTVGPSATIQQSKTVQMTATGTYDSGPPKTITKGVFWSSDTPNVASVDSTTGVVTGVSPGGPVTITGAISTFTPTATIRVTLTGLTSITISPATQSITSGSPQQYKAIGTANGKQVDITNVVTWAINAGIVIGVSIDSGTGLVTTTSGDTGTITVTATDPTTGIVSNTATLTIK